MSITHRIFLPKDNQVLTLVLAGKSLYFKPIVC